MPYNVLRVLVMDIVTKTFNLKKTTHAPTGLHNVQLKFMLTLLITNALIKMSTKGSKVYL